MLSEGYYFPEQRHEEQIIRFIHRRWLSFLPWIVFITLMVILPIILFSLWRDTIINSFGPEDVRYFIVGLSAYYLITLAVFLTAWIGYYLNVVLITPERLIDIRQNGLFNRLVAEQSLLRVQDVSARMNGFFQTFFLYGTVVVETAGESPNFVIPDLPMPNEVANTILKLHENLMKKTGFEEGDVSSGIGLEVPVHISKKRRQSKHIPNAKVEPEKKLVLSNNPSYKPLGPSYSSVYLPKTQQTVPTATVLTSKVKEGNVVVKPIKPIFEEKSIPPVQQIRKDPPLSFSATKINTTVPVLSKKENSINSKTQEGELIDGFSVKL